MRINDVSFENEKGLTLRGFVHEPASYTHAIVLLHGFPSHCTGFTTTRLATALAHRGLLVLRFDFSGTDLSDGTFEDKRMSDEVEDIRAAIDYLETTYAAQEIILHGHSTGAIDAALYAHTDDRVSRTVINGGVSDTKHAVRYDFTDEQVRRFWTDGHITYESPDDWFDGKRLDKAFYDEFFELDIPGAIAAYRKPLLIIHGERDEAIPVRDAIELYGLANEPKELAIIQGCDHRMSDPAHFQQVVDRIIRFAHKDYAQ